MTQTPMSRLELTHTQEPAPDRGRRLLRVVGVLTSAVILLGGGWVWLGGRISGITLLPTCRATALDRSTSLTPEQAGNAATIAAVAERRGLPARAVTIGIATAIQESKLRNIDYGDRDSVGLFQQRPSQGWGTAEQIMDPVYASNAFYDVLIKVEGYQNLEITKAAQQVQRSAFPAAYADHEPQARIFASALTGYSQSALTCTLPAASDLTAQQPGQNGLTPRAAAVLTAAAAETGRRGRAGAAPGAAPGTSVTFTLDGGEGQRRAWALAQWAVARADGLHLASVAVDGHRWTRSDGAEWVADSAAPDTRTVTMTVVAAS